MNVARIILSVLFISCMVWLWYPYFSQVDIIADEQTQTIAKPEIGRAHV